MLDDTMMPTANQITKQVFADSLQTWLASPDRLLAELPLFRAGLELWGQDPELTQRCLRALKIVMESPKATRKERVQAIQDTLTVAGKATANKNGMQSYLLAAAIQASETTLFLANRSAKRYVNQVAFSASRRVREDALFSASTQALPESALDRLTAKAFVANVLKDPDPTAAANELALAHKHSDKRSIMHKLTGKHLPDMQSAARRGQFLHHRGTTLIPMPGARS